MVVLVKHPTESVASSYIKAGGLVRNHERHGQWLERSGVRDALMRLCVPRIPSIALTSRVALPAVRP
jgi:hypothetical protein